MLYCVLRGLGGSKGSMVPNSNSRITGHVNQNPRSSLLNERMAHYLWNLEVFLVPVLDMDGLDITRQTVE